MRLWAALLLAAIFSLAACSSSGGAAHRTTEAGSSIATIPPNGLTGYGATRAEWDASHDANPDPKLDKGCCYGPSVVAPDNGGTADTWNIAGSGDIIDMITHNFAPDTSEREALSAVEGDDLPSDATLSHQATADTCKTLIYKSDSLAAAATGLGDSISVTLYGPLDTTTGDPSSYDSANVTQALESLGDDVNEGC